MTYHLGGTLVFSVGVSITASAGSKGSWTEIYASTTANASWLVLSVATTANNATCVDIGVGGSGSEIVIIPDLMGGLHSLSTMPGLVYTIPVRIPKGSRIAARAQGANVRLGLQGIAPRLNTPHGTGAAEGFGQVLSNPPRGTQLTPSSANTDTGWTQLVAVTSFQYEWMIINTSNHNAAGSASDGDWLTDIAVGPSGSEMPIFEDILLRTTSSKDMGFGLAHLPLRVPKGSRLSCRTRTTVTNATDKVLDVCGWGFA